MHAHVCVCVQLQECMCMLMPKCACVPVCVTERMNYLLVISHKKHIIQTAQDKALLNSITDYNHSPQPLRGSERNKSVEREWKRLKWRKEMISPSSECHFVCLSPAHPLACLSVCLSASPVFSSFLYFYPSSCGFSCVK